MKQRIHDVREKVKMKNPLIHCITNPISINQCANVILAVGGKPIMAEHPGEVRDITGTSEALLLNLGNITDVRMESMLISAKEARDKEIPIVLDAVGAACSALRRAFVWKILDVTVPTVIKGNYSEINALGNALYWSKGVDVDDSLDVNNVEKVAVTLAKKMGTTILASGKQDIITDGEVLIKVNNGTPRLSAVTGTGCMLGALCAAYLSSGTGIEAALSSCAVLGISGELVSAEKGNGMFQVCLMDSISTLEDADIETYLDLEKPSKMILKDLAYE